MGERGEQIPEPELSPEKLAILRRIVMDALEEERTGLEHFSEAQARRDNSIAENDAKN